MGDRDRLDARLRFTMGDRDRLDSLRQKLRANDPDTVGVYLDLSGRDTRRTMNDEAVLFGHALRSNTVVTRLSLDLNSRMTVEAMRGISEFISDDTTNLSEVYFSLARVSGDNISHDVANQLLEAVAENGRIQKLTWGGPFSTRSLVLCLTSLRVTLRSLSFEQFCTPAIPAFNARRDAEMLANAVRSLCRLEELFFIGALKIADEPFLTPFLNQLGHRDEHPLVLKELGLDGFQGNSEPVARALCQFLAAARDLDHFMFRCVDNGSFGIVLNAIGEQKSIRHLQLSGRITEEHTARIAHVLRNNPNISSLNLHSSESSLLHVCTIVEALVETRHQLQHLDLELNREIFGLEAFVAGHQRLGELLPRLTSLKTLGIIMVGDSEREDVELFELPPGIEEQFVSGFRDNTSLTTAEISWDVDFQYDPPESVERAMEFYTVRNRVRPALDGASVAGMLSVFADSNASGLGSTHFDYPESSLSVVFETLHGRADWFPDFESVERAIEFYTVRNRVRPALDGASVAGMLSVFADSNASGLGSTHFDYPESSLSVVFETLHGRADWFPDFEPVSPSTPFGHDDEE